MTPEQALHLLDSLAAGVSLTREQHAQVIVAVRTLRSLVSSTPANAAD